MFTWGATGSSLRLGGRSLRQGSLEKLHLFMCIRTFCGAVNLVSLELSENFSCGNQYPLSRLPSVKLPLSNRVDCRESVSSQAVDLPKSRRMQNTVKLDLRKLIDVNHGIRTLAIGS